MVEAHFLRTMEGTSTSLANALFLGAAIEAVTLFGLMKWLVGKFPSEILGQEVVGRGGSYWLVAVGKTDVRGLANGLVDLVWRWRMHRCAWRNCSARVFVFSGGEIFWGRIEDFWEVFQSRRQVFLNLFYMVQFNSVSARQSWRWLVYSVDQNCHTS